MLFDKLMGICFNPDMHREITFKTLATERPAGSTESALRAYGWKIVYN